MSLEFIVLPEERILLYEFKHTDGEVKKEHYHQVHQVLYALEGEGSITLDGKSFPFNQDSVAVIVPNTVHAVKSNSKLTVLVLAFDESIYEAAVRSELLHRYFDKSHYYQPRSFDGNELRQLLRRVLFEQAGDNTLRYLAIKIALSELLIVLARSRQAQHLSDANSLRAERIRHYIDTHYFEIMNATDISSKYGISSRYLNAIFKEQFKITPMQYLTDIRIEMAKKMLVETDKEIAAICFELGFETVSTFYRIFKGTAKIPPNKYRSLYKNQERDRNYFNKS